MPTILIHAGRALTPTTEINDAGILIREDSIEAIGPRSSITLPAGAREILATDKTAIPGFIDLHIHGAGGHDVMREPARRWAPSPAKSRNTAPHRWSPPR